MCKLNVQETKHALLAAKAGYSHNLQFRVLTPTVQKGYTHCSTNVWTSLPVTVDMHFRNWTKLTDKYKKKSKMADKWTTTTLNSGIMQYTTHSSTTWASSKKTARLFSHRSNSSIPVLNRAIGINYSFLHCISSPVTGHSYSLVNLLYTCKPINTRYVSTSSHTILQVVQHTTNILR